MCLQNVDPASLGRWLCTALGGIIAAVEPALPYAYICTLAILFDCYTAWRLGRRVRKTHPQQVKKDSHKFKSHHFGKVVRTIAEAWAIILLAFLVEQYITAGLPIDMNKVAAGAICFWQFWSILENMSSCQDSKWAKILQKIMVDKTERHFKISLDDLKSLSDEDSQKEQ